MGQTPPPSSDIETGRGHSPYNQQKNQKTPHNHKGLSRPQPPPPPKFSLPEPQPWLPWLVPLIFLANVVLFVYSMYINDCPSKLGKDQCLFSNILERFAFQPFKQNPLLGPSTTTLENLGGLERRLVVNDKQVWRLMTCIWLHAGIIHLAANMLSLLFLGIRLEKEFGFLRIGILYILSGLGGSLLSCLHLGPANKEILSVGASGAIFGLLGAMLSELITNWSIYANKCCALTTLLIVIFLNLAVGFIPHVDNSAHIGGFLAGFFLGFIVLIRPQFGYVSRKHIPQGYHMKRPKSKYRSYQYVLLILATLTLLCGYAVAFALLYT